MVGVVRTRVESFERVRRSRLNLHGTFKQNSYLSPAQVETPDFLWILLLLTLAPSLLHHPQTRKILPQPDKRWAQNLPPLTFQLCKMRATSCLNSFRRMRK